MAKIPGSVLLVDDDEFVLLSIKLLLEPHFVSVKTVNNPERIPALFDRACFEALLALPDESGAKALIESRPDQVAAVQFDKGAIDIDTPGDFERLTS